MKMKKENRGLTLVELMITIAILAIVLAAATSFMITGSRSFTKGSADSDLQKEAELTVNQIEDMVIDANINGGLRWTPDVDGDGNKNELRIYHATQEDDGTGTLETKYFGESVVWTSDEKMYYNKWKLEYDNSSKSYVDGDQIATDQLLAEKVSLFEVDLDTVDETASDGTVRQVIRGVQIRVGYENSFGDVEYATSPIITLRNRMILGDDPDFEVPPTASLADNTKLYYSGPEFEGIVPIIDTVSEVYCGNDYQIYAWQIGGNDVSDLVEWEIETENRSSTIDPSSGLLRVGVNESNEYLDIVARYKTNPNKFARGVVKVVGDKKSFAAITITTRSLNPFNPKYDSYPTFTPSEDWTPEERATLTYEWTVSRPDLVESMNSINGDPSTLELKIKQDPSSYDQVFDITVTAYCRITNETRSDRIQYRVDSKGTTGGDNNMKRGMLTHSLIEYEFDARSKHTENNVSEVDYEYECYFCDIYGNMRTEDNQLYGDSLRFEIFDVWTAKYKLALSEDLPISREFYIKVSIKFYPKSASTWTYERIHYIPAVQLFETGTYEETSHGYYNVSYALVGYWNVTLQNNSQILKYELVPNGLVYEPADQPLEVTFGNTWSEQDGSDKVTVQCIVHIPGNSYLPAEIKLKSMKFKVTLNMPGHEGEEVYTYVTVFFKNNNE